MDRGAWQAIVHRFAKSRMQLNQFSTHTLFLIQFYSPNWNILIKSQSGHCKIIFNRCCFVSFSSNHFYNFKQEKSTLNTHSHTHTHTHTYIHSNTYTHFLQRFTEPSVEGPQIVQIREEEIMSLFLYRTLLLLGRFSGKK